MPTRPLRERATTRSFVDILRDRAGEDPGRHAFSFLVDGEQQADTLTYGELDRRARALAARLVGEGAAGERVLLLLPPGLDYLVGVFGILYAGAVVVPAFPPRPGRSTRGVDTIIEDAAAAFALRRAGGRPVETDALRRMVDIDPAEVDGALAETWRPPRIRPGQLALLQYTSGSTSAPRGAMATHDQLISMSAAIREICGATPEDRGLWWVPPYHDLGLFASILQPVFVGNPTTLMPPLAFLQRPMRWLEAMSRERATMGGGPNFAYELVVEQSRAEERAALDLSSWRIALNGAEPVRPETMARFAEAFAPAGFRREAFFVAYGLAEALPVTTTRVGAGTSSVVLDAAALGSRRAQPSDAGPGATTEIVSCGVPAPEAAVAIVSPETRRRMPDGAIGEVWVSGPNVIRSYWRRPADTRRVLRARIAGEGATPWLRTGDLGFLRDGELYVTGRLKEMLIIRGRNYYPLDIERTVEEAHPDIRRSGVAAVGLPGIGDDRLAVVAEVQRRSKTAPDALLAAIRQAIADEHDLRASRIVLITEGRLPRTSSGKIQRLAAATAVQNNDLKAIADWTDASLLEPTVFQDEAVSPLPGRAAGPPARAIERWLAAHLAEKLGVAPDSLDRNAPFASFGLGSVEATALAGELATFLDRPLSPTLTWEFPTIERLAHHLADDPVDAPDPYVAAPQEPIAIVGIGLRMPGADTLDEFRDLLRNGRDAIRRTPDERWDADAYYDPTPATPGKIVTPNGGFLDGVSLFDPQFFGISPREASRMDPQQRIILEVTQAALDSAGIAPASLAGSATGVFIGIGAFEYSLGPASTGDITVIDAHIGTGNAHSIAANRVSFLYDLRGPSVALDTACSSSLVAIHLACQSLYNRETDAALAGGVNLIVAPTFSIAASQARMLSPDGLCKTFDASADGYVRVGGRVGRRPQAARRCAARRGPDPRADPEHGREPGRPDERDHRTEWPSTAGSGPHRAGEGGHQGGRSRRDRGAWNRNRDRRPDRGERARRGRRPAHRGRAADLARLGQGQRRPHGGCLRDGRAREGDPRAPAR